MTDQSIRPRTLRVAAVQMTATADRARNLATADRLVREAAARGAQLVALPEKWALYAQSSVVAEGAEPLDGPAISWARAVARELGIDLVAGSLSERATAPHTRNANTSVHVGPDGETKAIYRKLHLFDVEIAGASYRESEHERPGDELVVSRTAQGIGLGLSICYDLRFPELYRILAVRGARILVVPAAFTLTTTREHWEVLLRARAIEDQCFALAPNQIGEHAPGLRSGGRSLIVDPWGVVLAQAPDAETVVVADLDLDAQDDVRRRVPSLASRRPDVYRWPEPEPS